MLSVSKEKFVSDMLKAQEMKRALKADIQAEEERAAIADYFSYRANLTYRGKKHIPRKYQN